MALTYAYNDAYLKASVTEDRETRALADVNALATFAEPWLGKLTVLRAYILTCLECQASPDDLFSDKLKHYRQEWTAILSAAKEATVDEDGNSIPSFSIPLERA